MNDYIKILISSNDLGERVDLLISKKIENLSRNRIQNLILDSKVLYNKKKVCNRSLLIKEEGCIEINIPKPSNLNIKPQKMDLNILYEDKDLIVINKKAGIVVHPGAGKQEKTLVSGLIEHCKNSLSGVGGVLRPGIVHRIDKMTSGVLVIAKNDETHNKLSEQFRERVVQKKYICFTWNSLNLPKGIIDKNINRSKFNRKKMTVCQKNEGKQAITEYELKKKFDFDGISICFYECKLLTGRTHQIRVHFSHMQTPLLGDDIYKKNVNTANLPFDVKNLIEEDFILKKRQALHAKSLEFFHPKKKKNMFFEAEIPVDLKKLLNSLVKTVT